MSSIRPLNGAVEHTATPMRTRSQGALHPVGTGTWTFGDAPIDSPGTDAEVAALRYAIRLGQNHIDTAESYAKGGAERVVGRAIADVPRDDLFVASKLWKDHVAESTVRAAVAAMLERLGTDYLDLLYIHHPWPNSPWREALPQIDDLIDEGVVRHLGVSNFDADQMREASMLARHPIAANQIEFSCSCRQEASDELAAFCRAHGTMIVAYRPLDQGKLIDHPMMVDLAKRHDATPAQIALAWVLAKDALPIPKALRTEHVAQNAAAIDVRLSADDIAILDRAF